MHCGFYVLWFLCIFMRFLCIVGEGEVKGEHGGIIMMVGPNSRAGKGGKERGEEKEKGECGGMMMIAPTLVQEGREGEE